MSPMVPMKVLGLTLDAENNAPILVLQQDGGSEILPIWIGTSEALAISVALNGTRLDRPLTHETMFQAIRALDADIGAVECNGGSWFDCGRGLGSFPGPQPVPVGSPWLSGGIAAE